MNDDILPTTVAVLAPRMLHRYRARVEKARTFIERIEEDRRLLSIWENVSKKGCIVGNLTTEEATVVAKAVVAIESGD